MTEVVLGVDIGGTNSVLGLIDREGCVLYENSILTEGTQPFSEFLNRFNLAVDGAMASQENLKCIGIGIGAPNGNHFSGIIQDPPNLSWGDVNIVSQFEDLFSLPVKLTNDANAAAMGEKYFGAGNSLNDFIVITLGTGLGSGIISGGNLVYGHDGLAGELGHLSVDPNGRLCSCGLRGCLEMYVSAKGMKYTVEQFQHEFSNDSFYSSLDSKNVDGKAIDQAVDHGNESAIKLYEFMGEKLGFGLAQAATLFSPKAFIFYGGYSQAGDRLFDHTRKAMESYLMDNLKGKISIMDSALPHGQAGILGAASLIWSA